MPCINRVRIINFSYNNDARHILDETFDFHRGENALLNLANGGGKSVLVQVMLQPVVPRAKIQNRSIAEFFKKKKTPAYVLIEWKLDEAGGYLLTGIAMAPVETKASEEDEKGRIRQFCFIVRYTRANEYDLANIELARHEDGIIHIMSYKQAQDMMQEARRRNPLDISYFPQDETEEHKRKLIEFGISQDEWKNVLIRINDSEGGLEDIFSKCRTSDQLLNEWLIRTIDKALALSSDKDREDKSLQAMFENLLNETINSEEFIKEQALLKGFLPKFDALREQTAVITSSLERRSAFESELAAMVSSLSQKKNRQSERRMAIQNELDDIIAKQLHIDQEESSVKFHEAYEKWALCEEKKRQAKDRLDSAETEKSEIESRLKAMKGAGFRERIGECKAQIEAINEKIAEAMGNGETLTRIRILKASLFKLWSDRVCILSNERETLGKKLDELQKIRDSLKNRYGELNIQIKKITQEQGKIKTRIDLFENEENQLCASLGIQPIRNFIGELSEKEAARAESILADKFKKAERVKLELEQEELRLRCDIEKWRSEQDILDQRRQDTKIDLNTLDAELEEYRKADETYRRVLVENGLPVKEDKSAALIALNQKLGDLRQRITKTGREIHNLMTTIDDLRFGRYHIQGEWIQYLADANISYQTGEDYLRQLQPEMRNQILGAMPFLPYSLLITPGDMAALPEILKDKVQRNVIPIITYDSLKSVLSGETEKVGDGCGWAYKLDNRNGDVLALVTLYDREALDSNSAAEMLGRAEKQCQELKASLDNLQESMTRLTRDIQIVKDYRYTPEWKNEKETQKAKLERIMADAEAKIYQLKAEVEKAEERSIHLLRELIPDAKKLFDKRTEETKAWKNHMASNNAYEADRRQWASYAQQISNIDAEVSKIREEEEGLPVRLADLTVKYKNAEQTEQNGQEKIKEYEGNSLQPGEDIESGTCESLEAYLDELVKNQNSTFETLNTQLKSRKDELSAYEKEYRKLKLPEDMELPRYDADSEESLEQERDLYGERLEELRNDWHEKDKAENVEKTKLGYAQDGLVKTGLKEPLEKSDIYGDFAGRRRQLNHERGKLNEEDKAIEKEIAGMEAGCRRITDVIDISAVKPVESLVLDDNWEEQMNRAINSLKAEKNRFDAEKERFHSQYTILRNEYGNSDPIIGTLFESLDAMLMKASDSYEPFYYLYERMTEQSELLAQQISMLNTRLESLDRNRADVIQHCWFHGAKIYEELKRIEQSSVVRLEGRVTPVTMLKIGMELDSAESARIRMQNYIDKSIQEVREDYRVDRMGKTDKDIRNSIDRLIRSRELLNAYLGTTQIPVSVYKIDINMRNSRHKIWEDAVRENSGGEKFVIYFTILSALMAYSRSQEQLARSGGEDAIRARKRVLIMDNPFGPISSQHLLKPLFEIAKRYNTQLICLTDLKQSSILNNFNLIYMLRVRRGAASNNEYLKFEQYKRSDSVEENDESLEKAFYRVSDYKQLNLWE